MIFRPTESQIARSFDTAGVLRRMPTGHLYVKSLVRSVLTLYNEDEIREHVPLFDTGGSSRKTAVEYFRDMFSAMEGDPEARDDYLATAEAYRPINRRLFEATMTALDAKVELNRPDNPAVDNFGWTVDSQLARLLMTCDTARVDRPGIDEYHEATTQAARLQAAAQIGLVLPYTPFFSAE